MTARKNFDMPSLHRNLFENLLAVRGGIVILTINGNILIGQSDHVETSFRRAYTTNILLFYD